MKDALGRTTTSYDAAGRVTVQAQPTIKRVSYSYDAADRRSYVTDPDGGRTSYTHDSAGQLTLVNAPGAGRTSLAYDSAGRLLTRLAGGGARISHVYDNAGQLLVVASSNTSGLVNRFSYSYDNASRRTLMKQSDGTRTTYAYDASGQLTREWRTGGVLAVNATFSYDPAGNRTLLIDSGLRTTSSYDAANQHTLDVGSTSRTTYSYDQAGNRSQSNGPSGVTAYTWDAHHRLTQVAPPTNPVTLSYDGDGRRMKKQTASATRQFVYDFEKVLQETDGGGTTQQQYAGTEEQYGELLSSWGGGQARYYGFDGLGSTDALLALDGTTPDRYAYRAFGQATHYQGASDNRFDWVGSQGYYDDSEIGLYYGRARYYDPRTGRWLSQDSLGFATGDVNLYRYVSNSPANFIDPSGNACEYEDALPIYCGLDITKILKKALKELKARFDKLVPEKKYAACYLMTTLNGWDIPALTFDNKKELFTKAGCGEGQCNATVTVNKECHWAENVNYVLWGRMCHLCGQWMDGKIVETLDNRLFLNFTDSTGRKRKAPLLLDYTSLTKVVRVVRQYRRLRLDFSSEGRQAWTKAGWHNDFSKASGVRVKTCPLCRTEYGGIIDVRVGVHMKRSGKPSAEIEFDVRAD
jgi:RHS repeat-associated protein